MTRPDSGPSPLSSHASFLPTLGVKRCSRCGEKHRIKGGHQKNGRFVCAICFAHTHSPKATTP